MKHIIARLALCLIIGSTLASPTFAIPIVDYDTLTGQLFFDTNGEDIVSLLVEGPAALSIDRWQDGIVQDGVTWAQAYFANKEQWVAVSLTSPPDAVYQLATYANGLTANDFGPVEIGIASSPTVFTTVNIISNVPAPATWMLLGLGISALGWSKRKQRP